MKKALLIGGGVVLLLAVLAAATGYWLVLLPNTASFDDERSLYLPPGTDFEAALDSLESQDVLGSRTSLTWMGRLTGWQDQIKPGHYLIPSDASNYDLLEKLRKGLQDPVRLTIPPGSRPEVVSAVVGANMLFEAADFEAALRDSSLAADLGTDVQHLFGYMLPETYFVYWLWDPERVVRKIKDDFDAFYTDSMAQRAEDKGLTTEEVLTLASIVEWETYVVDEKPRVAGVYLNRLDRGWRLDADPTVQYAVLEREGSKRRLLFKDYETQHPYNTYLYAGLPPGPVTNPSPSSIEAVVNAEDHRYMFFVASPEADGSHVFSRTLREHNNAANRYRRALRERQRQQQAQ